MHGLSGKDAMAQANDPIRQVRQSELNAAMQREDKLTSLVLQCRKDLIEKDSIASAYCKENKVLTKQVKRKKFWNGNWKLVALAAAIYAILK